MPDPADAGVHISGTISNVQGQAAIGSQIQQTETRIAIGAGPTATEIEELAAAFAALRAQVAREAPPDVRDEAIRRAEALEQAATRPDPDVPAMAAARRWFLDHVPALFGAVTAVLVNPIVGKVVHAAGDAIAEEYRRRFPEADTQET